MAQPSRVLRTAAVILASSGSGSALTAHGALVRYELGVRIALDPEQIGRIQAIVPAISPIPTTWAMPCLPWGGINQGVFTVPLVGAVAGAVPTGLAAQEARAEPAAPEEAAAMAKAMAVTAAKRSIGSFTLP